MRLLALPCAFAALLAPQAAHAQLPGVFESLFQQVNSIVFYTQVGAFTDNAEFEGDVGGFGVTGLGTELLLDLPSALDTDFELGLGTSFVRGFDATEPTLDLRGSIRTLPQISVYASGFGDMERGALNPYLGISFGVADLWNARGYDEAGTIYRANAETFELGLVGGLYVEASALRGLYLEAGYKLRRFESLTWTGESLADEGWTLPEGWPRAADASQAFVNVGWQFRLRSE
ncbi:MAG TPA: hypothetical protein VK002_15085 [Rubricoccaceae bacterium]|nr:hypothetical protein [Rubricoccaceae bacterium]